VTAFVSTHYMDEAEYCDRIGLIDRGELIAVGAPTELKARAAREAVIEVVCDRPQDAMGLIDGRPEVKRVALFGRGLHVVAGDAAVAVPAVAAVLRDHHCPVERIGQIMPSMEDVFVALIEERGRLEPPRAEVRR
jgi:ABC-2 type transport system ATP-binding protein